MSAKGVDPFEPCQLRCADHDNCHVLCVVVRARLLASVAGCAVVALLAAALPLAPIPLFCNQLFYFYFVLAVCT